MDFKDQLIDGKDFKTFEGQPDITQRTLPSAQLLERSKTREEF